ncbi:hypothetical protein SBDP1_470001 [Syntrophobacter sp. SbD1]|nr:hypothetical protein SBDP1_470001 [Syntrophobacter sp. SbD1]
MPPFRIGNCKCHIRSFRMDTTLPFFSLCALIQHISKINILVKAECDLTIAHRMMFYPLCPSSPFVADQVEEAE